MSNDVMKNAVERTFMYCHEASRKGLFTSLAMVVATGGQCTLMDSLQAVCCRKSDKGEMQMTFSFSF